MQEVSKMAKKNEGKKFEEDIEASFPTDFFIERYKDDTAGFSGVYNPADYRLYKYPLTFLLELKSHKRKSLPLANIRENQLKGMLEATQYKGVYGGFLINFRDLEETYYVTVKDVMEHFFIVGNDGKLTPVGRKSIPVKWCMGYGIKLEQKKKISRYTYNLNEWLGGYYV